jgi:phage terminase large subunit
MGRTKEIKVTPLYYDHVLNNKYTVVIELGGRFSAKSYNEQIRLTANLGSKKDYTLLVIEDLEKNMVSGFYSGLKDKIEQFGHDPAYSMIKSPPLITNKINKNKALFLGYKSDQQKKAVKALDQITEILVEEGEWLTYDDFIALLHQLRGGSPDDRKLTVLLNPVNEYCFINEMFIETPPDRVIEYFPSSNRPKIFERDIVTTFEYNGQVVEDTTIILVVLSTHHDNSYLTTTQRASIEVLKTTDPEKYKQLGECRFIKSGGVYFNEFSRDIHVCSPFVIPQHWRRYFVMDYGLDMLAGYWVAVSDNNKAYFYKEIYESDLIISGAAKEINRRTDEKIHQYFAPPDMWNRRQETGKSAAEIFVDNGIRFTKTDNSRVQGWLNCKEWLAPYDDEQGILTASVQIFSNCTNLIRCMSQVKRSERDPNDVASEPHELTHAPDAFRGFFAGRPVPYKPVIKKQIDYINNFNTKPKQSGGFVQW